MGINTGWGGSGGGGPITVDDITATGTPSVSTYLRGDGAWATPESANTLGTATQETDAQTLTVTLSEAVGDDDYICVAFNFETSAGSQNISLFMNGNTDPTGYQVNGVDNTAVIFSGLDGSVRAGFLQICPTPYAGDLLINGQGVLLGPGATYYYKSLTGLGGITSFTLHSSSGQIKAGSNISVSRLSGVGIQGPEGPAGADGADGAGAEPWQTATQASNGNTLTLTLSPTGDAFKVVGQITSQSASSATEIEFNGSTGGHTYRHHFSGGVDNNAGGYFPPGVVGSGVTCVFSGTIQRIGEEIIADLLVTLPTALSHSEVRKTITGATNINALRVFSNQANGIGAGSYISAQKVN